MVLDASLLNTQHYKVRINGKVDQSRERSSTLGVVAIDKGAFQVALDNDLQLHLQYIYIYIYIYIVYGYHYLTW